jgi:4-hydroxy-3-polyprenylbenzoate decarboxylase
VIASVGPPRRELAREVPPGLSLPSGFSAPQLALPGVLVIQGPRIEPQPTFQRSSPATDSPNWQADMERLCHELQVVSATHPAQFDKLPLIVVVDDSPFVARNIGNFLWVTFTRSNPAADIHGSGATTRDKHWGCTGPLLIDARVKPHHAPALIEDPEVSRKIDALAARGGPLARWL